MWDRLQAKLVEFDQVIARLGIAVPNASPIAVQLQQIRTFLAGLPDSATPEFIKTLGCDFETFMNSVIAVRRIVQCISALGAQPRRELRERTEKVLVGPISQDFEPSQAKDFLYELEIAMAFQLAGFVVHLREPDIVIEGNGLSQSLGVACKYPSSYAQIHEHISRGYKQITRQNMNGLVSIGLDLIVGKFAFGHQPPRVLDFRTTTEGPLEVTQNHMNRAMQQLITERGRDYPAEPALDGALVSLQLWGIYGKPAGVLGVSAWALQRGDQSPVGTDLEIIYNKVNGLKQ